MSLAETAQLVLAAREGEAEAREALLERLRPRIVLWAATRMSPKLRERHEPEDVAQEILLTVHRDLDGFEYREYPAFLAWLFRLGENRIRDLVRHAEAKKRQRPEPRSREDPTPSKVAALDEGIRSVLVAIERLAPEHREVIRLRRLQELPCSEVARIMGRSPNAVRILYCRALKAIRKEMGLADGSSVRNGSRPGTSAVADGEGVP